MSDPKKFQELRIGDSVADMHDGLKSAVHYVVEPLEVLDLIQFHLAGGYDFIQKIIKPVTYYNKHLVVIDDLDYEGEVAVVRCMYSYDDIFFGTAKLRIKVPTELPDFVKPPHKRSKPQIPHLTVVRDEVRFECGIKDAPGSPIVGRGHSILEAVGEYCIQTQLVHVVADPPKMINTDYRVSRSINTAKLVREGCDQR